LEEQPDRFELLNRLLARVQDSLQYILCPVSCSRLKGFNMCGT
jgi:hypothetical protein